MAQPFITINGVACPYPRRGLQFMTATLVDAARNTENEEQEENGPGQEGQLMRRPAKTQNIPLDAEWVSAEDS